MQRVAALYVDANGIYPKLAHVDAWDVQRDASKYDGPDPVVAHPPCGPWGSLAHLYTGNEHELAVIAVDQVRRFGGVLEHPARSRLWDELQLPRPGDLFADAFGGYSIEVCQVDFGHVARKRTWLYLVGVPRSALTFPEHREPTHWISGFRCSTHRSSYKSNGSAVPPGIKVCSAQQRRRTPREFAEWLVELARAVRQKRVEVDAA